MFTEEQIYDYLGVKPQEQEPAQEQEPDQEGQGAAQEGQGTGQEGMETAEGQEGQRTAQEGAEGQGGQEPDRESQQGQEDGQTGQEGQQEPLSMEERERNAARRRRWEQKKAIDAAVAQALEQERQKQDQQWAAFFAGAGMSDPATGKPITSRQEYDAYRQGMEQRRLQENLQKGTLLPDDIAALVRRELERQTAAEGDASPQVRRASVSPEGEGQPPRQTSGAFAEERGGARERGEPRRTAGESGADFGPTKAQIDAELAEIRRMDPEMVDLQAILQSETGPAFRAAVGRGASFLEAFKLANFERLTAKARTDAAQRAAQAERNGQRGKEHLRSTSSAGSGSAPVPAEVMAMYKRLNPGKSEAEIREHYNKCHKK